MEAQSWTDVVMEKLKELLLILENFGGKMVGWLDTVFPPGTREEQLRHWLHVAAPFAIAVVVLLICFCCCRWCCCGRRSVRMMKAPGRNYRMPRHAFEGNPRSYFRNLRGKPADELL